MVVITALVNVAIVRFYTSAAPGALGRVRMRAVEVGRGGGGVSWQHLVGLSVCHY